MKIETEMATSVASAIWAQKIRDFQGPTLTMAWVMDLPASKSLSPSAIWKTDTLVFFMYMSFFTFLGPNGHFSTQKQGWRSCIRIQSGHWIQIRIRIRIWTRIQIQEGKKDQQKEKKFRNFMFWSAGCSLLRAQGFFCGRLEMGKF